MERCASSTVPSKRSAHKVCADCGLKLRGKGVALKATEQSVDTSSAAGKAFFDMLGVFAEFETNLRRERQLEGIKAAKAKGIYKGRKPSIDPAQVRHLLEVEGLGPLGDRAPARHRACLGLPGPRWQRR